MTPVHSHPPFASSMAEAPGVGLNPSNVLRSQLVEEIRSLNEVFSPYPFLTDPLTVNLKNWKQKYEEALELTVDIETVRREYLGFLSQWLVDAYSRSPLDEAPLLGSDGFTYSTQFLSVHIGTTVEPFNKRSPNDLQNEMALTVTTHPIATPMKRWLEERRAFCPSNPLYEEGYLAVRREYIKLVHSGRCPSLPMVDLDTILKPYRGKYFDSVRRKIPAECTALQEHIRKHSDFTDVFTRNVREWLGDFKEAFRVTADAEKVLKDFIGRMQVLSIDARTLKPLDADAFLGSDGLTYSKQSLGVYRTQTPEPARSRSPVNKEDLRPFVVRAHGIARYMVLWLEKQEARLHDEEMKAAFQAGGSIEDLPIVEGDPSKIADRLYAQARQEEHQKARANAAKAKGGSAASSARQEGAKFRENFAKGAQSAHKAAQEGTKGMYAKADEAEAKAKEDYENLKRKAEETKANVAGLDAEIGGVEKGLGRADEALGQAERDNEKLQRSIDEVKEDIEKAKKEQSSRISSSLLAIGACVIVTLAINYAAPGSGVTATPISGGFKGSIVIPI